MHVLRRLGSCSLLRMNSSLLYPYIQIMQLRPRSRAGQIEHEDLCTLDNLTDLSACISKYHRLRRECSRRLVSCTDYNLRCWRRHIFDPRTGIAMPQLLLSDERWSKLQEILLHNAVYNKRDLRMTVEGMLYRMRTGCPGETCPKPLESGTRSTNASIRGHAVKLGGAANRQARAFGTAADPDALGAIV
jgi:hypothetical protein